MKVTFLLSFFFFLFFSCLSLPSSETEQEYVYKDKNSIVYTDRHRLGNEGEKKTHLLNTNEDSRLVCEYVGSEATCHLLLVAESSLSSSPLTTGRSYGKHSDFRKVTVHEIAKADAHKPSLYPFAAVCHLRPKFTNDNFVLNSPF